MRASYLTAYGGNEVVSSGELPEPVLSEGTSLIEIKAAGVNPVELAMRAGGFQRVLPYTFPQVPGFDISGVVREVSGPSQFKVGDEVYARMSNRAPGAYAELAVVANDLLARKPTKISHIEAASLPTVALTGWQAFFERANLKKGDRVLVQAGAGGVGTFAIQLAKHFGAHVTATASTANQAFLKELGVDIAVDYTQQRFEDFGPFDVVYDGVCGDLVESSINTLTPGGRYVGLVMMADARAFMSLGLPEAMAKGAAAGVAKHEALAASRGAEFHGPLTRPDATQLAEIATLVDAGVIKPYVSQVFGLNQLKEAYEAIGTGRTRGKLVLDTSKRV
ncbi:Zinc-type alcohol dehydrogenase-like protein [compost metagenome]